MSIKEQIMSSDLLADYEYPYQLFMERLTFVGQVLSPLILFTVNKVFLWAKFRKGVVDFCSLKE
ncbi:MAG: hypothetical protein P8075_06755 [Deltaproteobacteria bacterium]|jgi:hypothetical protein